MTDKEILLREIDGLPDFMIKQLLDMVHYIRIGIESVYIPETDNDFYNTPEFGKFVSDAVADYKVGRTENMDTL